MTLKLNAHSVTLPAGRYLIIDPCDSLPEGEWDKAIDATNCFEDPCHTSFIKADGTPGLVVAFATAGGDGEFTDKDGNEYLVDAGLIGILSVDDVGEDEDTTYGGAVHEFSTPFRCYRSGDTIVFGHVEINTNQDDGESDEDFGDIDNDY